MSTADCIFCKIVDGEIPATKVYRGRGLHRVQRLSPQAPTHILIVPREHIDSLDKAAERITRNARPFAVDAG